MMFIHFSAHDILIFVSNYDKNSLNTNVPYVIAPNLNAFNLIFLPNPFYNLFEFPTTIPTKNSIIFFTFEVSKL